MRTFSTLLSISAVLGAAACGDSGQDGAGGAGGATPTDAPALGTGDGSPESVIFTLIADASADAGMAFGPDGKLYFADLIGDRVLRVDPL